MLGSIETGDTAQGDFSMDYVVIQCVPAADFEMEYRVSWTGETCTATTKRLRIESFHTDTENILLQVDDGTDLGVWVTRITILETTDTGGYRTWPLSTAEWDSGEPLIRFIGATEAGDSTQTDFNIDHLHILCELLDYEAETRYDWSGVDTTGDSWTLIINCQREIFPDDTESLLIQVLTPPGTWNTRYTCDQEADTAYDTYALTSAELNGGAPALRFLDANQAEDQFDTDWWIDVALIRRDYTAVIGGEIRGNRAFQLTPFCYYNAITTEETCRDVSPWAAGAKVASVCFALDGGEPRCTGRGGIVTLQTGDPWLSFGVARHNLRMTANFTNGAPLAPQRYYLDTDGLPRLILLVSLITFATLTVWTGARRRRRT
jgi:hypothetical protein